jgi:hypothetical protein
MAAFLFAAGTLTRLLQLAALSLSTIKSWSGFAGDVCFRTSKCSAMFVDYYAICIV